MRLLVYTSVFGGFDRVYPPLRLDTGIDHVIVTDDAAMQVRGWRTVVADRTRFATDQAANRYYKMLAHREFPGYDASVYVDGNIRLLGRTQDFVAPFLASGAALGAYRHPLRQTVAAEIEACVAEGKIRQRAAVDAEWEAYRADGFEDDQGLIEATILLKNHSHPLLDPAMAVWWAQFERYGTRDQVSLPYAKWKTGLPCFHPAGSFRDPNPYFGLYPHAGAAHVPPLYAHVAARAFDNGFHRLCLAAWHAKWTLQRRLRRTAASVR